MWRAGIAGGVALALLSGSAPASAAAAPEVLRLRASAVDVLARTFERVEAGIGYSTVSLGRGLGLPAFCDALGAGAYDGETFNGTALKPGGRFARSSPGPTGGFYNPTVARDTAPHHAPGENFDRERPRVRDIADGHTVLDLPASDHGVRWFADCTDTGSGGRATAYDADATVARAVGSTTSAAVGRDGTYVGASRTFIAGLSTPSGALDLVSSALRVRYVAGGEPTISYAIGVSGGALAHDLSLSGVDVPLSRLTRQFNAAVTENAPAVSALGELGLTLVGPTIGPADREYGPTVAAPFLELRVGQVRTRLVQAAFDLTGDILPDAPSV